jgi:hypothetical protein
MTTLQSQNRRLRSFWISLFVGRPCQNDVRGSPYRGTLSALTLVAVTLCSFSSNAGDGPSEWPPLRPGVWELVDKRVAPSGKIKHIESRRAACHDTRVLFWGYWGSELGIGGCGFDSAKLTDNTFRVRALCEVTGHRRGVSESLVTINGTDAFELTVTVTEGRKVYRGTGIGRRVADCPAKAEGGS